MLFDICQALFLKKVYFLTHLTALLAFRETVRQKLPESD
jgi:hypothetical protein